MSRLSSVRRLFDPFRALARQLAAAVYVHIAFGLFGQLWPSIWLEFLLTLLTGLLLARLVEGPWWTSGLVGVFVVLFNVGLGLVTGGAVEGLGTFLSDLSPLLVGVPLSGLLGALLGRRWRRRAGRDLPPTSPPADPLP